MSNYQKDDIVEFFYENGGSGFGLVIEVHDSETIGFVTVAELDVCGKYIQIPFYRIKDTWRNLKGYVTRCDELTAEVAQLKCTLENVKKHLIIHRDHSVQSCRQDGKTYQAMNEFMARFCNGLLELINTDTEKGGEDEVR